MFHETLLWLFEHAVRDRMSDYSFQKLRLKARRKGELWVRYRMVIRKMSNDTVMVYAVEGDHVVVLYRRDELLAELYF